MRERGASWQVLGVRSEYSLSVNGYPKRSTLGACVLFCFRVPAWVLGYPRWGPPPQPGPAVHSIGVTALHLAAARGNRRIVRSLVAFGADVNAQNRFGCAVPACGESAGECGG